MQYLWQTRRRRLDLTRHGLIMGVVNVTPDSFSDGGRFLSVPAAVAHGRALLAEGAGILDVGGESTRPGAEPVPPDEQMRRVLPVIAELRAQSHALISVDTASAEVAAAAITAGADIINDVTGLRGDPAMTRVAAETGAGVVIMHMQGEPRTMQINPHYRDVVHEVRDFFLERLEAAEKAGLGAAAIVFDPGVGFGKNLEHNLSLLAAIETLAPAPERPLLLGASRKASSDQSSGPLTSPTAIGRQSH